MSALELYLHARIRLAKLLLQLLLGGGNPGCFLASVVQPEPPGAVTTHALYMPTLIKQLDELIAHRRGREHTEVREEQGDVARRRVVARGLLRDKVVRRRPEAHEGGVLSLGLVLRQIVLRWQRVQAGAAGLVRRQIVQRGAEGCRGCLQACESGNMRANLVDSAAT